MLIERCEQKKSWPRTIRKIAYVLRWKHVPNRIRTANEDFSTRLKLGFPLTTKECELAERLIIIEYQKKEFGYEYDSCVKNRPIIRGPLKNLCPFVDDKGLLRMGGRLEHAYASYDERHPIIIPKLDIPNPNGENWKTVSTRKLIDQAHYDTLHGGVEKTWAHLRFKYHNRMEEMHLNIPSIDVLFAEG